MGQNRKCALPIDPEISELPDALSIDLEIKERNNKAKNQKQEENNTEEGTDEDTQEKECRAKVRKLRR